MSRQQAIEALRDKFASSPDAAWLVEEVDRLNRKTQSFFEREAAAARVPHCGVAHREMIQALLVRAQEAGLFNPEQS